MIAMIPIFLCIFLLCIAFRLFVFYGMLVALSFAWCIK